MLNFKLSTFSSSEPYSAGNNTQPYCPSRFPCFSASPSPSASARAICTGTNANHHFTQRLALQPTSLGDYLQRQLTRLQARVTVERVKRQEQQTTSSGGVLGWTVLGTTSLEGPGLQCMSQSGGCVKEILALGPLLLSFPSDQPNQSSPC